MDELARSWSSFSPETAAGYLTKYGHPSANSRRMLVDLIGEYARGKRITVLDLGCGNGNLFSALKAANIDVVYTGVDFSDALLAAARAAITSTEARFIAADVNTLEGVSGTFDVAVYSHVLEMLGSPERSLKAARALARLIMIRFFEPPDFPDDSVELRQLTLAGENAMYIRRKLGRDYYRLMLAKIDCREVDVYRDEIAKDQIHVLHYRTESVV